MKEGGRRLVSLGSRILRRQWSKDIAHGMRNGVPSRVHLCLFRIEKVDIEVDVVATLSSHNNIIGRTWQTKHGA